MAGLAEVREELGEAVRHEVRVEPLLLVVEPVIGDLLRATLLFERGVPRLVLVHDAQGVRLVLEPLGLRLALLPRRLFVLRRPLIVGPHEREVGVGVLLDPGLARDGLPALPLLDLRPPAVDHRVDVVAVKLEIPTELLADDGADGCDELIFQARVAAPADVLRDVGKELLGGLRVLEDILAARQPALAHLLGDLVLEVPAVGGIETRRIHLREERALVLHRRADPRVAEDLVVRGSHRVVRVADVVEDERDAILARVVLEVERLPGGRALPEFLAVREGLERILAVLLADPLHDVFDGVAVEDVDAVEHPPLHALDELDLRGAEGGLCGEPVGGRERGVL